MENSQNKLNNISQEKQTNLRTKSYSPTDAGITFLLALVAPSILMILVQMICSQITGLPFYSADETIKTFVNTYQTAYIIICAIVPQISFLIVFFGISEYRKVNYQKANGFTFKLDYKILLVVLLVGVVAIFGFNWLVNLFDYLTTQWGYAGGAVSSIDVSTVPKLLLAILYAGVLPAVCEELIFRGIITNGVKKLGLVTAVIVSSLLFALMHQNLQQLLYQLILGAVMAYIMLKTGKIVYTMVLHLFNNITILVFSYFAGGTAVDYKSAEYVSYYSNAWNVIWPILVALLAVCAIIGLLFLLNYIVGRKQYGTIDDKKSVDNKNIENGVEVPENSQSDVKMVKENGEIVTANQLSENNKEQKGFLGIMQSPFLVVSIVAGIVFWFYAIISTFK